MKKTASEGSLQLGKPAEKEPLRERDTESLCSQSQHFLPKGKKNQHCNKKGASLKLDHKDLAESVKF